MKYIEKRLEPDFLRLPEELCWRHERVEASAAKKRKVIDDSAEAVQQKLLRLEQAEQGEDNVEEVEDEEDGSEGSQEHPGSAVASDDDFGEEDNDYCANYFDNGEGYGDLGSDDNMDGEEY
ncbi:hypothetical protein COOONC_18715 [Cooperia oncophora]